MAKDYGFRAKMHSFAGAPLLPTAKALPKDTRLQQINQRARIHWNILTDYAEPFWKDLPRQEFINFSISTC